MSKVKIILLFEFIASLISFSYKYVIVLENVIHLLTDMPIRTIRDYQMKWEPLIRMDSAYNATKDSSSITMDGVNIMWHDGGEDDEGHYISNIGI